jgi:hypothetical protein
MMNYMVRMKTTPFMVEKAMIASPVEKDSIN